tara:strand:+ start:3262 stop:3864 length:603 start_codon:yes stop_codon:yes gene_type:complete
MVSYLALDYDAKNEKIKTNNDSNPFYWFFINAFLRARIHKQCPSNDGYFDEDVNAYIAGLLTELAERLKPILPDICLYEVMSNVDKRQDFNLCRQQADALLIRCGVFPNFNNVRTEPNLDHNISRCANWYYKAACLGTQLPINHGIIDIFFKLAKHVDKYVELLDKTRHESLGIIERMSKADLRELMTLATKENELRDFD